MHTRLALYPGTFDLLTNGHLDIIKRAARLFDNVVVGVARNDAKKPLFATAERREILSEVCLRFGNVTVEEFEGLTVEFAKQIGAQVIVRGLRFVSDFEYELQMSLMNRSMAPEIETMFFSPAAEYSFVSSSLVREIAARKGDVSKYIPVEMAQRLAKKFDAK